MANFRWQQKVGSVVSLAQAGTTVVDMQGRRLGSSMEK